jgi:hypothetical protein
MKTLYLTQLCISFSTLVLGQGDNYQLNKERTSQVFKKYSPGTFQVYTVMVEEIVSADSTRSKKYLKDIEIEDVTSLHGEFTVIGQFHIQLYNTKEFERNQLIDRSFLENRGDETNGKSFHPLLYSKSKNEYYLDAGYVKLIYECGTKGEITSILATINKAGFKTSDSKGDHMIHTPIGTLTLTADIVEAVKNGSTKYITDLSLSVKAFSQLLNESKPLINKLADHYNAHRSRTMTTERIAIWKQDVLKADGILKKMTSLKGAEKENTVNFNYQFSTETLNKYNEFWGVVTGSKTVLGL